MDSAERLMDQVAEADFSAFETVYDTYHRLVYAIAYRIVGTHSGAEDVTQSVFVTVWASPRSFRGGSVRHWLATVARNRSLDVVRARQPDQLLDRVLNEADCARGVDDVVAQQIDGERARGALASLPETQRMPIELAFFAGLTHREIAQQTALPLGTIKTRIRDGLRTLRTRLEPEIAR